MGLLISAPFVQNSLTIAIKILNAFLIKNLLIGYNPQHMCRKMFIVVLFGDFLKNAGKKYLSTIEADSINI